MTNVPVTCIQTNLAEWGFVELQGNLAAKSGQLAGLELGTLTLAEQVSLLTFFFGLEMCAL